MDWPPTAKALLFHIMIIAQISDPHVTPRGRLYKGFVDSNALFAAALRTLAALDPRPDLVLLTGDVVDEGGDADYATAREMLAEVGPPLLVLPGNHDEREAFRRCFSDHPHLPAIGPLHFLRDDLGPVRIIGLDVTVPGEHHGILDDAAAEWLDAALGRDPARPTVVMMHQPPFSTGVPYLDDYLCREGHRLASVLSRYPAVERVLCGHVHRFMTLRFAGTLLCTAPSTATSIALTIRPDAAPASFLEPPAFLLHRWTAATGFVTHVVPVGSFPGPLPFA